MDFSSIISNPLQKLLLSKGKKALSTNPIKPLDECSVDFHNGDSGDRFTVGFGKCVMLPADIEKKKYYIAGYGENNPARGVIDPQYAHAMWIDDNTGRGGVLFISLDIVGILNKDVNKIRHILKGFCNRTGCRSINVCSTHNHAGIDTMGIWGRLPFSGKDPNFMELLFNSVLTACETAYNSRKDGDLYLGTIGVPDMQEDIRTPIVYSKTLTRFRFAPLDGSDEVWLLNFASHSESLQGSNHLVSADFPCYLRERIKDKTGADVVYTVGAIGGMISMDIPEEDKLRREHRLLESTRNIGYKLAEYAISIDNDTKLSCKVDFARREFYIGADNTILTLACYIGLLEADRYADPSLPKYLCLKTEITYFEIGGKKLLLLPCEIFPELVFGGFLGAEESATGKGAEVNPQILTEICEDEEILVFGLANDELGYVVPPNDFILNPTAPYLENARDKFNRKHYEETNSMGPDTAFTIAENVRSIIEAVKNAKAQ
jgi:hypothetical protein